MNSFRLFGILFSILVSISIHAADGSGPSGRFNFRQKSERKETSRWTLQEWLAQKERNKMMDLWLGMYAPSPYEFYIKGSYLSYQTKTEPIVTENTYQSYAGGIGAYATVIGLEGDYENNTQEQFNDLSGSLNLRILGNAVQGTHLILHYGLRTRNFQMSGVDHRLANQFAGADLNLYLTRYFGLFGIYNAYLPTDDDSLGTVKGSRTEAGLFIDFEALRIFGNWFSDVQTSELAGTESRLERSGIQSGLQFFF